MTKNNELGPLEIAYWRWQFLKLNEAYIEGADLFELLEKVESQAENETEKQGVSSARLELALGMKAMFEIFPPLSPSFNIRKPSADTQIKRNSKAALLLNSFREFSPKVFCRQSEYVSLHDEKGMLKNLCRKTDKELGTTKFIDINIDLDAPIAAVQKEITEILKKWRSYRRKTSKQHDSRNRLKLYKEYLNLYELKSKGLTDIKIAKMMYPNEFAKGPHSARNNNAVRNVQSRLKTTKELIEGGYRRIQ